MDSINIFEHATRHKFRFDSTKGALSVEQLWDLPLSSSDGFNLDAIARNVNKALKDATEESFVTTRKTAAAAQLEMKLELVKSVIATKLADEKAAKERTEKRAEKQKLLEILAKKQDGKLDELSEKELQRRINALGD